MTRTPLIAGRYELGPCIGRGGMGAVLRALDTVSGESVAVKRLLREVRSSDPASVERFLREGEALRDLNHPNIAKMLGMVEEGGDHYLVMELVAGGSLETALREAGGSLSIERVLNLALDLSDALTRAHRLDIVHRDLKPSNVLIAQDGTPRLTDFGVAYIAGKERLSGTKAVVGTLDYLSPEVLTGETPDARADIWSFGVLLFEMLTGRRPFGAGHAGATLHAILTAQPPDLEALRQDCPVELADLVYRMLEKDRHQRIPSVRRIGAELESILTGKDADESAKRWKPSTRFAVEGGGAEEGAVRPTVEATADTFGLSQVVELRRAVATHNLPSSPTPFVGREAELAKLAELLNDPATRLVTIVGPGGMGKSRLVIEVGRLITDRKGTFQLALGAESPFPKGVFLVELAAIESPELILSSIADAIGFRFYPGSEPKAQLLSYLREKKLLLLVDNFEHLLEGASIVADILQACPGVKVLATSREQLGLSLETVFPLWGMGFPTSMHDGDRADFSAVRLFVQAARRVKLDFETEQSNGKEIAHICRLVQGMPLAIVLAASWANVLTLDDIAREIGAGFDFLQAKLRDLPERQRSIRSVFDHSWKLLGPEERQVFARLSVFRGGFGRDAASVVAGATLRALASLLNKSLVTRHPDSGRYEVHELLRQYAESRLGEEREDRERTLDRHATFYAGFLEQRERRLWIAPEIAACEVDAELDNVRAAWSRLLATKQVEQIERATTALDHYFGARALFVDAAATFGATAAMLERAEDSQQSRIHRLLGYVLSLKAEYVDQLGRGEEASRLLERALLLLDATTSPRERAYALVQAARVSRGGASPEQRIASAMEALKCFQSLNDSWGSARALATVAEVAWFLSGDLLEGERRFRECIAVQESSSDGVVLPYGLAGLGFVLALQGRYSEGLASMLDGLAIIERRHDDWTKLGCLGQLADIQRSLGNYVEAERTARTSITLSHDKGHWETEMWARLQLGLILQEQGRFDEASSHYQTVHAACASNSEDTTIIGAQTKYHLGDLAMQREEYAKSRHYLIESRREFEFNWNQLGVARASNALGLLAHYEGECELALEHFRRAHGIARVTHYHPVGLSVLAGVGLCLKARAPIRAVELLSLVKSHPATSHGTKTRLVNPLLDELAVTLGAREFAAAVERGKKLDPAVPLPEL